MNADELRTRFLRERVLTASPAQRVVMLYDRLVLDLGRTAADTSTERTRHIDHAVQVVAELRASLDEGAGGPAENLASIYGYLLRELIAARGGAVDRLPKLVEIVETLRAAWVQVAQETPQASGTAAAGAWVG